MRFEFTVPGDPRGKGRHRMTKKGIAYTAKETVYYENLVKTCFHSQCRGCYLQGPIKARIDMYLSIPQSESKKRKSMMELGELRPTKKPDIDNVIKIILDSLNGIAYHDDSAVIECNVRKMYAVQPRIEVVLEEWSYGGMLG